MDWGLWSKNAGDNFLLRKELILKKKKHWMYYAMMVIDLVFRLVWIIEVFVGSYFQPSYNIVLFASIEILRRSLWAYFRVELEALMNWEQYRTIDYVPRLVAQSDNNNNKENKEKERKETRDTDSVESSRDSSPLFLSDFAYAQPTNHSIQDDYKAIKHGKERSSYQVPSTKDDTYIISKNNNNSKLIKVNQHQISKSLGYDYDTNRELF
jgi:hypothetical protein